MGLSALVLLLEVFVLSRNENTVGTRLISFEILGMTVDLNILFGLSR